ncbi:helix-turn-helix domain-containing protein [Chryseobacterium sp. SN22]|nr:helix-turn-helix domain-containing protein [Chryseobacterium sp. SN22]
MTAPDYRKIYEDMIRMKYPDKETLCRSILEKKNIDLFDVIRLNAIITGKNAQEKIQGDQKLKSYDKDTILQILDYQKKHGMNNTALASHFKLSRNTVAKWRKLFSPIDTVLDEPFY